MVVSLPDISAIGITIAAKNFDFELSVKVMLSILLDTSPENVPAK